MQLSRASFFFGLLKRGTVYLFDLRCCTVILSFLLLI